MNKYQVFSIPSDNGFLHEAFGISDVRISEINDFITNNINKYETIPDIIEALTEIAQNNQETGLICYIIGFNSNIDVSFFNEEEDDE